MLTAFVGTYWSVSY